MLQSNMKNHLMPSKNIVDLCGAGEKYRIRFQIRLFFWRVMESLFYVFPTNFTVLATQANNTGSLVSLDQALLPICNSSA